MITVFAATFLTSDRSKIVQECVFEPDDKREFELYLEAAKAFGFILELNKYVDFDLVAEGYFYCHSEQGEIDRMVNSYEVYEVAA